MSRPRALLARLPPPLARLARRLLRLRSSRARRRSNDWLRRQAASVRGAVLSIGSGSDRDGEGGRYRDYFVHADRYVTSEVVPHPDCDLVLDVRAMPEVASASFDAVFASGVLEHVDDVAAAVAEIARVLAPGGTLLLGLPFRQGLHLEPHDYWRFTEHGIRWLLRDGFEIRELVAIDRRVRSFPATYWVRAERR